MVVDDSPELDAEIFNMEEFEGADWVLIVVDDSPELDAEIFNMEEYEGADWVLISDETPVDENRRDELLEAFQVRYHPGAVSEDDDETEDELEEDDQEVGRE